MQLLSLVEDCSCIINVTIKNKQLFIATSQNNNYDHYNFYYTAVPNPHVSLNRSPLDIYIHHDTQ